MIAAGQDGEEIVPPIERVIAWTGTPDGSGNFTATLTSLTPGTKYYFEIEDSSPGSAVSYGGGDATTTGRTAPAAPAIVHAVQDPNNYKLVDVSWTNSPDNEGSYDVQVLDG